ncbi:MAG: ferric reductase-like transmembrane domain-containing protein [Gammaproteobacteria bacterium]|nr:ferric reductase-like transmembrane domain-containing protein [Gammaproteobacteria bacterium]MBU2435576.1 ferric reductase-like transmembrane domain-containing protein [Gammaproteobacteria bacterium]MBU2449644.1 ferric reductase-like transmembrane domain-containing protein [Gammaproteobacteria bacterium]
MKILLGSLLAIVSLAWGMDVVATGGSSGGTLPWVIRQEALYLSGLLSIALMSLAMFLSTRPAWLETPLGGMDRVYRTHKWAGILAVSFAVVHWLVEEVVGDILKAIVGREGRIPKEQFTGFLEVMRDLAKDMGEWAFYLVLAMLVITLWKRFPYKTWRAVHQAMPVLYLMLALHAAMLAPTDYWAQPVGILIAVLGAAGIYGALFSLVGRIGRARRASGTVTAIEQPAPDVLGVSCQLDNNWRGHRPGQFAFITFDEKEGAHPFTIASADRGDRSISFQIKALGDYTRTLGKRLEVGRAVKVEGPYGRFDMTRQDSSAQQIWIAGGIGVTPFLAWLDSLQQSANQVSADLHYCTRDRTNDPFVALLEASCTALPGIRLHIHGAQQGEILSAADVAAAQAGSRRSEIWFCGPQGLAEKLKHELGRIGQGRVRFHQEAFEMR